MKEEFEFDKDKISKLSIADLYAIRQVAAEHIKDGNNFWNSIYKFVDGRLTAEIITMKK